MTNVADSASNDQTRTLSERVARLESDLAAARARNAELSRAMQSLGGSGGDLAVPISEYEETLRRLVQRTAMIIQCEKCVIAVQDRDTGELVARAPAFGMSDDDVQTFRVPVDSGIAGEVFCKGQPSTFSESDEPSAADAQVFARLKLRNGIMVPLMIERRDDQNHIVDRSTIGVLHCFNKRYDAQFIDEDVRLLLRLSHNAASVIANAQMFRDVVEEKKKLVHTLESLRAGLVLINNDGLLVQTNAHARAMFDIPITNDRRSPPYTEVIHHDQGLKIIRAKIEELSSPENRGEEEDADREPDEISLYDKDGVEFVYQLQAAPVRGESDRSLGTVVLFTDVTDIRNVERMKTEFVSIVSHELRTPLTPMKGFVRTLLDDEDESLYTRDDRREFYGIIDANVDRLSRLINDLLNVSRIEKRGVEGMEMNFEQVDLRDAVEAVVATQRGMTDKHELAIDLEPDHIVLDADPDKIQNILQNLVSNAIKYSPGGGEVRIIGRLEPDRESVLIGVQDHGMGIPDAALKNLFTKFYRVDSSSTRKVGGTGLGLFLVKSLVAAHRGAIWPESAPGKGSTFWFRIPIHQQCGARTPEPASAAPSERTDS